MERELGWWRKYVFSTDHKVIGIQYAISGFVFLFFGFCLMMLMRWQLAYPGKPLPIIGKLFGSSMPGGVMTSDFYNSLGAMHGTIMVFLGVIPIGFAGFGNYIVPLQIGAPDMAFPKVNMFSYWALILGAVTLLTSFFLPTGAAASGWSSYTPLADIAQLGHGHAILTSQSFWLIGIVFLATSSVLGSINVITTIVQLRALGMTWMRLPFFVWAQLVAAFLLLLAFPPMEAGTIMQLMDRIAGTSFYLPSALVVNGQKMLVAGGGSPLLWQHLFWFLIHPEVYVLVLPAMGIVAEIVANNTRKPLYGYKGMVFSVLVLAFFLFSFGPTTCFSPGWGKR
jgi:cytochrome c oxidase subunit I